MTPPSIPTPLVAADDLLEALKAIAALEPEPYNFPADWSEQVKACAECQRWEGHPIQLGICDAHRRPLWDREKHDKHEEVRLGYRAKLTARDAIAKAYRA